MSLSKKRAAQDPFSLYDDPLFSLSKRKKLNDGRVGRGEEEDSQFEYLQEPEYLAGNPLFRSRSGKQLRKKKVLFAAAGAEQLGRKSC